MLASEDSSLPNEFTNINGILNAFMATNTGAPGSWASWGDAGILVSIQNGLALEKKKEYISGYEPADTAWQAYFHSYFREGATNNTLRLWGAAEAQGTRYGRLLAGENGQSKSPGELAFLVVGDAYRTLLLNRAEPSTLKGPQLFKDMYGGFLDTSATIPYTDIAPVSLVGYFLLQWK